MSIKTEILGVWRNSKIEYVFNEKNNTINNTCFQFERMF